MRVKIIRKNFGGVEFGPEMRVLHLGGQSSANVERLKFELPQEWGRDVPVTLAHPAAGRHTADTDPAGRGVQRSGGQGIYRQPLRQLDAGWLWVRTDTGR